MPGIQAILAVPLALALGILATTEAEGQARGRPSARWIGQDGRDLVGPNSAPAPAPSGVQDVHIRLTGLPSLAVEHAVIRGLGGDEWQVNGPNGPFRAYLERQGKSPSADLYLEPTRVETGRGFTINLTFEGGGTAEIIFDGGKADPALRMPEARLKGRWIGQDGRDRAGPGPAVGPDGRVDAVVALENLTPGVAVEAVALAASDGVAWEAGLNPKARPNGEFVRNADDPSRGEFLFQPDRDRKGQTLRLGVRYANGTVDTSSLVAGGADPSRSVPAPKLPDFLPHSIQARWIGQDADVVRVSLDELPAGEIIAAALSDPVGGCWMWGNPPIQAASYSMPMTLRTDGNRGELAFPPIRDESGAGLTLHLLYKGGRQALITIPGGKADPDLRGGPEPAGPARTARPGDDLHALVATGGVVRLAAGNHDLDRPLVLERPTAIVGETGAILRFRQAADAPPWSAAIKVHAGRTTLEGFAVRFDGSVRWAEGVSYGPAVIGTTDNLDTGQHALKAGLVFRKLDLEGPPSEPGQEAVRLIRLATAENGRVEGCRLRGGMVEFLGGPWVIEGNEYLGCPVGTFSFAVFAGHRTHDLILRDNTTRDDGPSGKTWRFLVLTVSGANDLVAGNRVEDVGPRDTDEASANAPEIILTEAYRLRFEGRPLGLSTDGRLLAIPDPQGDPAEPGDVVAVVEGPKAGTFARIAQRIDRTTYLLAEPLPSEAATVAVSIATGFVGERFEGNRIDARGGSVAAGFVLAGNLFGLTLARNEIRGCGEAIRVVAAPTEHPGPWGWSHAPAFGLAIEGNTLEDPVRGLTVAVEHGPPVKSTVGRVYLTGRLADNLLKSGRPGASIVVGDPRSRDPSELVLTTSGNRGGGTLTVHAARIEGREVRDRSIPLPSR